MPKVYLIYENMNHSVILFSVGWTMQEEKNDCGSRPVIQTHRKHSRMGRFFFFSTVFLKVVPGANNWVGMKGSGQGSYRIALPASLEPAIIP